MMRRTCLIGVVVAAGVAGAMLMPGPHSAAAQTAADVDLSKLAAVQSDLRVAATEEGALIAAITQAVDEAKSLMEDHNSRAVEIERLKPEGEELRKAFIAQNAAAEKQRMAVATHNESCPHETKDAVLVAKCNDEMGQLNAWATQIKADMERLEPSKDKYNRQVAEIQKHEHEILARLADLRRADIDQRQKLEAVRARMTELRATLASGKARCGEIEKAAEDAGKAEALAYCRAMIWNDVASERGPAAPPRD
jgi:peptidoglycan hydrolase CwlO-like protein